MSLLKQHDWFIHNIQSERFDDIAGTLLGDTAYIAENCMQNSIFRFLEDSIFERTMHCNFESLPYTGQGKWQWSPADSILTS